MIKKIIRKRSEFPKCIRHFKEVKGICIGGCIDESNTITPDAAHAHCVEGYGHIGWICLSHLYQLKEKYTLLHEVAHLIANKSKYTPCHGPQWRKAVVAIGGSYTSYFSYNKKFEYTDFSPKKRASK